ncbi:MAG: hypothetical protein WDN69_34270 [Aliidongia sp.]
MSRPYDAVLFDLLTALLDSWTLWNEVAGGAEAGQRWRTAYLRQTYATGAYRPYETLVAEAAEAVGLDRRLAEDARCPLCRAAALAGRRAGAVPPRRGGAETWYRDQLLAPPGARRGRSARPRFRLHCYRRGGGLVQAGSAPLPSGA